MSKKLSRLEELRADCAKVGLYFNTYSPGDNIPRYRFTCNKDASYFSENGIYTALGLKEAVTFAAGFVQGWWKKSEGN